MNFPVAFTPRDPNFHVMKSRHANKPPTKVKAWPRAREGRVLWTKSGAKIRSVLHFYPALWLFGGSDKTRANEKFFEWFHPFWERRTTAAVAKGQLIKFRLFDVPFSFSLWLCLIHSWLLTKDKLLQSESEFIARGNPDFCLLQCWHNHNTPT